MPFYRLGLRVRVRYRISEPRRLRVGGAQGRDGTDVRVRVRLKVRVRVRVRVGVRALPNYACGCHCMEGVS